MPRKMSAIETAFCAALNCKPKYMIARLVFLGHKDVCGRCGGSGHYSFNLMHGSMCYGCGGRGYVPVKLTKSLLETVKAEVESGALEPYFERNRRINNAKKAWDAAMSAWKAGYEKYDKTSRTASAFNKVVSAMTDFLGITPFNWVAIVKAGGYLVRFDKEKHEKPTSRCGRFVFVKLTEAETERFTTAIERVIGLITEACDEVGADSEVADMNDATEVHGKEPEAWTDRRKRLDAMVEKYRTKAINGERLPVAWNYRKKEIIWNE